MSLLPIQIFLIHNCLSSTTLLHYRVSFLVYWMPVSIALSLSLSSRSFHLQFFPSSAIPHSCLSCLPTSPAFALLPPVLHFFSANTMNASLTTTCLASNCFLPPSYILHCCLSRYCLPSPCLPHQHCPSVFLSHSFSSVCFPSCLLPCLAPATLHLHYPWLNHSICKQRCNTCLAFASFLRRPCHFFLHL